MAMQISTSSTYFYKVRKVLDMPQIVRVRYSPDAWFLGTLGFRAYYVRSTWSSSTISLGMYLSHCQSAMPRPVRGRIGVIDLTENKQQAILLADETKHDVVDWARGVEIELNLDRFKKFSVHGAYLFRFDVEML